jgi:hypothetical protein
MTLRTFAAAAALLIGTTAFASSSDVSLNDLPSHWEGVAGDLVTRVQATLDIGTIHSVARDTNDYFTVATYAVDADLAFGSNHLTVSSIALTVYEDMSKAYDITFTTTDELAPMVSASVRYDEVKNLWTMRRMDNGGGTQFVLTAPAKISTRN